MPPLPTEPEPPESIRGKEDQIDLYGAPVFGDQDNNSGDGTDYGAYETELHTDEDSNYPHLDQVSCSFLFFIRKKFNFYFFIFYQKALIDNKG